MCSQLENQEHPRCPGSVEMGAYGLYLQTLFTLFLKQIALLPIIMVVHFLSDFSGNKL